MKRLKMKKKRKNRGKLIKKGSDAKDSNVENDWRIKKDQKKASLLIEL